MSFYTALNFHGDHNIGFYGLATDRYCLLGPETDKTKKLHEILKVPIHKVHVLHMDLIRLFVAGNSHGIVVPNMLFDRDVDMLKHALSQHRAKILMLDTEYAIGNLVLMNDKGIVIPHILKRFQHELEKFFGINCGITNIAGLSPLGSLGIATNKGVLVHPQIKDNEAKIVEEALDVPVDVGTVNFGAPHPGSGIIANSHGFAAGTATSGPELGRIAETLGFD